MNKKINRWCTEPFRIFFPLGILSSIIGVLLWPFAFAGWLDYYPLEAHSRWMIIGFGGCLITGFIGTAGPRLIGASPWSYFELFWHLALCAFVLFFLYSAQITAADTFAGFWLIGVLCSMLWRLLFEKKDVPPPGIPMVFLGLLSGAVAAFALALNSMIGFDFLWQKFWRLCYFQGFVWIPIVGVAPYILPRFFGLSSKHSFNAAPFLPPGWKSQFMLSLVTGGLLLVSFAVEVWHTAPLGLTMRAIIFAAYFPLAIPGLLSLSRVNALALSLRWILPCAVTGWILAAFYPHMRIGISHLMFIGGPSLLMLAVSTRVFLGHNDRHDRLGFPLKWYHAVWALALLTAATRLSADFVPKVRTSHLIYAAVLWVIIVIFWGYKTIKESRIPRRDKGGLKSCPRREKRRLAREPKLESSSVEATQPELHHQVIRTKIPPQSSTDMPRRSRIHSDMSIVPPKRNLLVAKPNQTKPNHQSTENSAF